MAKATPEQTRRAHKAAAVTALVVAVFAACFIGLMSFLDTYAESLQEEEVIISENALDEPFYVLLVGSDTRKGTALYTGKATDHAQVDQHADVLTMVRVDPSAYTIDMLTIPRDTVIAEGGEKINSALLTDEPERVVEAVAELTGLKADYYMLTTFGMFADLVDAIGGVKADVALDVTVNDAGTGSTLTVKAGKDQLLNGAQALAIARARSEYDDDQDAMRQINVRMLEQAIIEQMLGGEGLGVEALMVVLEHDVRTNMDLSVLGPTVKDFVDHADEVSIRSATGPFEGAVRDDDGQWVVQGDTKAWKRIIRKFCKGGNYDTAIEQPSLEDIVKREKAASSGASSKESASSKSSSKSKASSSAASAKSKSSK